MIALWMLSVLLFTILLGGAALFAESALRLAGRQTRWPWLVTLIVAVAWPVAAPFVRRAMPTNGVLHLAATRVPTLYVLPEGPPVAASWAVRMDVVIIALWTLASVAMLARLVQSLVILSRVRRAARSRVVDGVPVLVTAGIGPAVVGVVRPRVLLPEALLDLDAPLRELVLRHEVEHCRAGDPWILLGSAFALAIVPWNLPLWWIARRARLALEVDCDARVVASGANASQYGKLLLFMAQRQTVATVAPMLAASNSHLERRIIVMHGPTPTHRRARISIAVAGMFVAVIAACTSKVGDAVAGPKAPRVISATDQLYFEFQVEKQARQVPGTGRLRYPDLLRSANVQGTVLAQFVVDGAGRYEPESFKVLKSDHQLFTDAVKNALPTVQFTPAEIGGAGVRQVVQQPYTFSLSRPEDVGARHVGSTRR